MSTLKANSFEHLDSTEANITLTVGSGVTISGVATASNFDGDGSALTNLNASNLASGTVDDARLGTVSSSKLSGALPALDASALVNVPEAGSVDVSLASTIGQTLTGSAVTSSAPTLLVFNRPGAGVTYGDYGQVSPADPIYNPYAQNVGLAITVGTGQSSITGIGSTTWEFDSGKGAGEIMVTKNYNQFIQLLSNDGNFQPGCAIRGRIPDRENNPYWDNGFCDLQVSTSAGMGITYSQVGFQTQGLNPAKHKKLQQGRINEKTTITGAEYKQHLVDWIGGNGRQAQGFTLLTKAGDVLHRQRRNATQWWIDCKPRTADLESPGLTLQSVMRNPPGGTYNYVPFSSEDIAAGITTSSTAATMEKAPTPENIGYPIKVIGCTNGTGNNTDVAVLTSKGYAWVTAPNNTDGFQNQGATTVYEYPRVLWTAAERDCQDLSDGSSRYIANLTSCHDNATVQSGNNQSYLAKVVSPSLGYNEMWCLGGDNTSGQHADDTTSVKSFATPCMMDVNDDPDTNRDYTGTFIRSNTLNVAGTSGTHISMTFEGTDPDFFVGEALRVDFSTGPTDDTYQVMSKISAGTYEIARWDQKNRRLNQSGSNNAVALTITGRSQLHRLLGRRIIGQWSGGANVGAHWIQDSEYNIWFVGDNGNGQAGDGTATTNKKLFTNVTDGTSLPKKEVYKAIVHGTNTSELYGIIILFSDGTLWQTGANQSGYGSGSTADINTWTQIAGPGSGYANAPSGKVLNFWPRMGTTSTNSNGAIWVVDYVEGEGFGHFCSGENSSGQLLDGTTTDNTSWTVPTRWLSDCGTIGSPTRTSTGWIMEQQWHMSQTSTSGQTIFCLARNLTTNEYRFLVWGNNSGMLAGVGQQSTSAITTPIQVNCPVDPIKVKQVMGTYHGTTVGGIGLIITHDGEIFGIGYVTDGSNNNRYRPFWDMGFTPQSAGALASTTGAWRTRAPDQWINVDLHKGGY